MSGLSRIMLKEIKELLTPATLVPIIIMALLFGSLGSVFSGVDDELAEKPRIGLLIEDKGVFGNLAQASFDQSCNIRYNGTDLSTSLDVLDDGDFKALIYVPGNFTSNIVGNESGWVQVYWYKTSSSMLESVGTSLVAGAIDTLAKDVSTYLIYYNVTNKASLVLDPVQTGHVTILNGQEMVGVTPSDIDSVVSQGQFVVPFIVMLVVIMAGSMVITSMGSEKENKTLETLLTLPVKRTWIVFGKLIGATIVGLIITFIYMLGLGYYYSSLTPTTAIDLGDYGMALTLMDYIVVGVVLFLSLLCGLGMCMILGIFTKNYKAAQTMTLPVTMLALIPMFISLFSDFGSLPPTLQGLVFAIPFSHPMFAITNILMGDYWLVLAGIAYTAMFAVVTMYIAVRLFKKDILLTGRVRSAEHRPKGQSPVINLLKDLFMKR